VAIAFRADASLQIGTGHVMRCLAMADALRERSVECGFICRPHAGHLLDLITQRGHQAWAFPALQERASSNHGGTAHADWLGTDWASDADETRQVLTGIDAEPLDWLVVDHYALDQRWERALRPNARRIMVIDDLADRSHDCDLLLDQNLGRTAQDYVGLLSPNTTKLIGPQYALLRPEFAELRPQSLTRRAQGPQLKHLMVTMGGVDKNNVTGQVLDALQSCTFPPDLRITVVMGPHAPWLMQVQAKSIHLPWPTKVLVGVSNMAQLMAESDLCIGAVGSTSWERCCLGLPTIQLVLAANQKEAALALTQMGVALSINASETLADDLRALMTSIDSQLMSTLTEQSAAICNGSGSNDVISHLLKT
jgi:UDP-2,4-diacetamido-2,4,6-trideoxy-beta-L-altropyranose hydrolase